MLDGEQIERELSRSWRLDRGPFELDRALDVAIQIARGLGAAHAVGVFHRDVKPENVMIRPDGLVKILDFGIAKLTAVAVETERAAHQNITRAGAVLGTVAYMSPGQARGMPVDARTDVWSLGVVLYELLTGSRPFEPGSTDETLVAGAPPPSRLRPALPPALDRVVARALAERRERSYPDAGSMVGDLERTRCGGPVGRPGSRLRRGQRWLRWR